MARLTKKQKEFADKYLETGNATQSALEAYDTDDPNTAGVIGHENLRKPKIIAFFEEKADTVANNIYRLALAAENENVQLRAGQDILDRAGYKPIERTDLTSGDKPIPILSTLNVHSDNSNKEDSEPGQEDPSSTGGNVSE